MPARTAKLRESREPDPPAEDRSNDNFAEADRDVTLEAAAQSQIREVLTDFESLNVTTEIPPSPSEPFALSERPAQVATPSEVSAQPSASHSSVMGESIFLEATPKQATVREPAIEQTRTFAAARATWHSDLILRQTWSTLRHLWSAPAIRISLFIGGALVVAAALATGVIMARHQNGVPTTPRQISSTWGSAPPVEAAGPVQSSLADSAMPVAMISADPIVPADGPKAKTTGTSERLPLRTKIATNTLSKPILRSSRPSISAEPPPMMANDPEIGQSLLDMSVPLPAPPSAFTGGQLQAPKLLSSVPPVYPSRALMEKVQGVVVINALIDNTGKVADMKVISGPARLIDAALNAVRLWKYEPGRLDGQPIATHTQVSVKFNLH
jgi:TonB family protein